MAINDLYQATFVQNYGSGGEECRNVFFYVGTTIAATAARLATTFVAADGVVPAINGTQTPQMKNASLAVVNLFSLTDFFEQAVSGAGTVGTNSMPPAVAVNYTLKLNTRGVRPGSKRFAGIAEEYVTNGLITDAGVIATLNALGVRLVEPLAVGAADEYAPVVVKRIRHEPDLTHPRVWYSLPTTEVEADYGTVVAFLLNLRTSHQVSRGNGR